MAVNKLLSVKSKSNKLTVQNIQFSHNRQSSIKTHREREEQIDDYSVKLLAVKSHFCINAEIDTS